MVEPKRTDVTGPGGVLRLAELWLDHQKRGFALAGENSDVIPFHAPVISEIEDVVRGTHHNRAQLLFDHPLAHSLELLLIDRVVHSFSPTPSRLGAATLGGSSPFRSKSSCPERAAPRRSIPERASLLPKSRMLPCL